jgi:hypothetical protein
MANLTIASAPSRPAPAVMHIHAEVLSAQRAETVDLPTSPSNTDSVGIENPFTQGAPATWVGQVRHTRDFAMLSECTCGAAVSQDKISAGRDVIRCKRTGCETQWVSLKSQQLMGAQISITQVTQLVKVIIQISLFVTLK